MTMMVEAAPGVAPAVALTAPADGAKVTAPTDASGRVSGGDWKLEYLSLAIRLSGAKANGE